MSDLVIVDVMLRQPLDHRVYAIWRVRLAQQKSPTPLQSRSWSAETRTLFREVIIEEARHLREILFGLWCPGISLVLRMRLAFEDLQLSLHPCCYSPLNRVMLREGGLRRIGLQMM
jgi:hypothetical protein